MTHWNGKKHKKKGRQLSFQLGWFISSLVGWWPACPPYEVDGVPTRNPVANSTEGVVGFIPLFYASGVNPKSPSGLALGFLVGTHQRRMAQTPWVFFRAASSCDDTEADQCSKNNFFGRVTFKNKNKNTSWTLLLMIYIFLRVTLEKGWWSQSNDWNERPSFRPLMSLMGSISFRGPFRTVFGMCNLRTACNKNNYVR